ncbi:helix-turn-helix transcriptional regulator [Ruegeria halocynthiae]|uniref:helix-turn-helix transcriptional regulator n=1 Tax=Ruegeria halocynthiae TaxID=985054 RepID=UPI0009DEF472|nr:helix-turn-helix transcriptional regulator [Ruegeria halocynthiae]
MSNSFSKSVCAQDSLNFVMEWAQALNGRKSISDVLNQLMRLASADAALISRLPVPSGKIKYVARHCIQEGKIWPYQPQAQAELILGACLKTAKTGSIWKLSDLTDAEGIPSLLCRDKIPSGLGEAIVVPLEVSAGHCDHLELHYQHRPARHNLDLVTVLASTLASGWGHRPPGSISAKLNQFRGHGVRAIGDAELTPILDPENPAALSRSEFRVCAMMKEGMTVKVISSTLSVCPATVRSHLSSIFSKTGASNQVELLHLLNRKADSTNNTRTFGAARFG